MDFATLRMRVEYKDIEAATAANKQLFNASVQVEQQAERTVTRTSQVAQDMRRLNTTTSDATRGMTQMRGAMQALAAQAVGLPGPLGRLSSVLLQMSVGGTVTVGVLAGIAAMGLAWRKFTEEAREAEKVLNDIRKEVDKLRQTVAGAAIIEIGKLNEGIRKAEEELRRVRAIPSARDAVTEERLLTQINNDQLRIAELRKIVEDEHAKAIGGVVLIEETLGQRQRENHARQVAAIQEQTRLWIQAAEAALEAERQRSAFMMTDRGLRAFIRDFNQRPLPGEDPSRPYSDAEKRERLAAMTGRPNVRSQLVGAGLSIVSDIGRDLMGGGSTFAAAAGGAITGAATGFAFGGPVGAAIGGFTGLIGGILGAGAAARRAMRQFQEFQEGIDRQLAQARIGITGSPLEQALATNREFFQRMRDEIEKNLETLNKGQRARVADQVNAQLAETLRLEELKARQLEAAHVREQERLREDLSVRLLRAQGYQREADDLAFLAQQERELADAISNHAGAATIAAIEITQAAERMARAAQLAAQQAQAEEDVRYRIRRGLGLLAAEGGTYAGQTFTAEQASAMLRLAEDTRFLIQQEQELAEARARGASEAEIYLLEQAQLIEAEARRLELLRREQMLREDLGVRLLRATARGTEAEAMAFALTQQREYLDAVLAGADATTLALLKEVQLAEARRRQADLMEEELEALRRRTGETRRTIEILQEFSRGAGLEYASPATRLMQTRSAFMEIADLARGGDQGAARQLPELARAFLDASRFYNASGLGFQSDLGLVERTMADLTGMFEDQVSVAERQLMVLEQIRDAIATGFPPPTDMNPPGPPEDEIAVLQAGFGALAIKVEALTLASERTARAVEAMVA